MSDGFLKKDDTNRKRIYITGGILGVAVTIAVMLIFSLVLLFSNLDRAYAAPFATISISAGTFFASRYAAKKIGDHGYLIGLVVGVVTFVIITVISLIVGNKFSMHTLFHFVIILLSSFVGGILGVNIKKSKKYI